MLIINYDEQLLVIRVGAFQVITASCSTNSLVKGISQKDIQHLWILI